MALDLDSCYRRYSPMVYRRCKRLLQSEQQAEDAMQDVFVKLMLYERKLEPTGLSSLLFRMATQVSLNRLRSQKRRPETLEQDLLQRIAHAGSTEEASSARSMLGRLFGAHDLNKHRISSELIATMHLLDGFTLEEVARETGLSVSGVRKRLRSLRSQLSELEKAAA